MKAWNAYTCFFNQGLKWLYEDKPFTTNKIIPYTGGKVFKFVTVVRNLRFAIRDVQRIFFNKKKDK